MQLNTFTCGISVFTRSPHICSKLDWTPVRDGFALSLLCRNV